MKVVNNPVSGPSKPFKNSTMHILFFLGHPAHFHLFRNTISQLKSRGHVVFILNKKKDVLDALLEKSGFPFHNVMPEGRGEGRLAIATGLLKRDVSLFAFCLKHRPDLMTGTSAEISHVGKILGIPSVCVNEDDYDVVPLFSQLAYPWSTHVLAPASCRTGKWENKTVHYPGYHELAYLHPDHFSPDRAVVREYFDSRQKYFLLRFAKLTAHHDAGIRGLSGELIAKIITILQPVGKIYISSERELEPEFERYRIAIRPEHMHDIVAFAALFVGDSQTMAAEAGALGVPFVRCNDFVGRIGYLNELELKYRLGFGFKPNQAVELVSQVTALASIEGIESEWKAKRARMLGDMINVAEFFTIFYENYPTSAITHMNGLVRGGHSPRE